MEPHESVTDGEEAARLLDRLAGQVPVRPAPVAKLVDDARRRHRHQLLTAVAVLVLAALLLGALI